MGPHRRLTGVGVAGTAVPQPHLQGPLHMGERSPYRLHRKWRRLVPHVQVSTHAPVQAQPLPDHPPPPYSEACSEGTGQSAVPVLSSSAARHLQASASSVLSSATPNRSPVRLHVDHQHRFQAEFGSSFHSRAPSSASSSRTSFVSAQHRGVRYQGFDDSDWDSSDVDSRRDEDDRDAIYTSPSRRRKGKGRATLNDDEDTPTPISGHSSSIHLLHNPDQRLHDRRHSRSHDNDDLATGHPTMPKSCLKPTPSSSSTSLSSTHFLTPSVSSSSISAQHEPSAPTRNPNLGVRFVRFTLGLGSGKARVKEREKEPKLICTTPGEACAGETETETDEPSSRRLPTARKPPPPASRLSSLGFGTWRRSPSSTLRTTSCNPLSLQPLAIVPLCASPQLSSVHIIRFLVLHDFKIHCISLPILPSTIGCAGTVRSHLLSVDARQFWRGG
ncbi:hypothetical protein FA13DRAFT_1331982 [Coprinellus micaceus]|uniref:Uncharacterized protein n=1 Tax=Coprinellus micaceus TaxID=71717 RepID=A0A4Y7TMU4_COPMI|nr:hypothetical protein FA13DRAFT_1331982 [Coprinellus micaceus]